MSQSLYEPSELSSNCVMLIFFLSFSAFIFPALFFLCVRGDKWARKWMVCGLGFHLFEWALIYCFNEYYHHIHGEYFGGPVGCYSLVISANLIVAVYYIAVLVGFGAKWLKERTKV